MPHMEQQASSAKPVAYKSYGTFECIGHATTPHLAMVAFAVGCPSLADQPVRVLERLVRLDGSLRSVYVVERVT